MANTNLYLHEIIHIVGTGSEAYKRHTGERRPSGPAGGLVGTWQQSGSAGDWPRVINLWEMAGWEGWAEILEYQYDPQRTGQPRALGRWWTEATKFRSGGFDRILEPAPGSEKPWHQSSSPETSRRRNRPRWASLPCWRIAGPIRST